MSKSSLSCQWPMPMRRLQETVLESGGEVPDSQPAASSTNNMATDAGKRDPFPVEQPFLEVHRLIRPPAQCKSESLKALRQELLKGATKEASPLVVSSSESAAGVFSRQQQRFVPVVVQPHSRAYLAAVTDRPGALLALEEIHNKACDIRRKLEAQKTDEGSFVMAAAQHFLAEAGGTGAAAGGAVSPGPSGTTATTTSGGESPLTSVAGTMDAIEAMLRFIDPCLCKELHKKVVEAEQRATQYIEAVEVLQRAVMHLKRTASRHGGALTSAGSPTLATTATGISLEATPGTKLPLLSSPSITPLSDTSTMLGVTNTAGSLLAPPPSAVAIVQRIPSDVLQEYDALLVKMESMNGLVAEATHYAARLQTLHPVHEAALRNLAVVEDSIAAYKLCKMTLPQAKEQAEMLMRVHEDSLVTAKQQIGKLRERFQKLKR